MNFGTVVKAFDTFMALTSVAKKVAGGVSGIAGPATDIVMRPGGQTNGQGSGLVGQIETRLTNVVVAALKEAFDRDHARLEIERQHLEEQRRRAEEAMRQELRRQAIDRESARLRMLGATALVGWIISMAIFAMRVSSASVPSRWVIAAGWVLLLGALAASFGAQSRLGAASDVSAPVDSGPQGVAALYLLTVGLAASAISLLV